ncbi:19752_t:CDS:2 [Gigaspora rosea]|nr:19752_t:CDS:2 [Gigaspora rosea]
MGYDKGYILKKNDIFNAVSAIRNSDDPDFSELPIVGIQRFVEEGIIYTKFNVWKANLVG